MKGGETFYDVLGVDKKCSQDDIKKAYRKLSFIHHPDKNGNSQESTENFQKISEAFTVLSDPDERMKYDITRSNPFAGLGGGGGGGGGGIRINPMDIFNMFMGGGGGGGMEHHPMNGFVNLGGLGGFVFEIEHLNGKKFAFNSSAGNIIRDGLVKTIPKLGIQRGTERGNLNVAFKVVYPEKLTETQIKTLAETL